MKTNRYVRQTLLDRVGDSGQAKLQASHVVIIGCGGLGSIAAPYLAGAGIGRLTLVDGDVPDVTNLHRQVFFSDRPSNGTKSEELASHIESLNPDVDVDVFNTMISKENVASVLKSADVVLECTDNIQAKYLVNDYCAIHQVPMVYGAIHKYDGFVSFFENKNKGSTHLRDIFPQPSNDIPSCSEVGVLGTIAGLIGILQANEAIKYITGAGDNLIGKMLSYDILTNSQMILKLKKSWTQGMVSLFDKEEYKMDISCDIPEISYSTLLANRSRYQVVSILEDHEHINIDENVARIPLSICEVEEWQGDTDKTYIFYCMSGKRSSSFVQRILANGYKGKVFSLSGGLRATKE